MPRKQCRILMVLIGLIFWPAVSLWADKIILKDGTVEETDRVWASEKYIHFILKGTTSVEIRFLKDIVQRVESDSLTFPTDSPSAAGTKIPETEARPASGLIGSKMKPPQPPHQLDEALPRLNRGVSFYDPRRPQRYWADRNTRFDTLAQALTAIASRYGRTTAWVTNHMGEENDLGLIYANLNQRLARESDETTSSQPSPEPTTGAGEEMKIPAEKMKATLPDGPTLDELAPVEGIAFYDPRRTPKYRVGPDEGYETLNEALNALAKKYQTTVQWVGGHMGETNALTEIHRNIRQSLEK